AQGLIWGIMAIGVYITFRILDIADLTVDGSICTGAAVCTMLMINGTPVWLALIAATVAGLIAGALTGTLHIVFGIPAILSGILTQLVLWSVNLKIMGKANRPLSARSFGVLISQMNIPAAIGILAVCSVLLVVLLYLFFGTELGASIRSTGINAAMSRAQGINTDVRKLMGLSLSNGIVAFSGALLCQYQGYTDINMGRGAVVIGLAAVVIGEAVISKLPSNFAVRLVGVIIGAIIYYIVYQVIIFFGLDPDLLKMFSAIVVAVFLGTPYVKRKISANRGIQKEGKKNA
ncbi:MAG: ABC transporter permease, partial [Clostridia bacterium]|nr:ABC transporter permease [Clostridia bacterium]